VSVVMCLGVGVLGRAGGVGILNSGIRRGGGGEGVCAPACPSLSVSLSVCLSHAYLPTYLPTYLSIEAHRAEQGSDRRARHYGGY
jgi:hypothetical protein